MAPEIEEVGNHDSIQSEMMGEMCLVVDIEDNVTGVESKLICHNNDGIRHRAFSVLIFDSKGRLLLQKRSFEKILAELKAEDDYFTNLEQEMKLEDYSYRQNSFVDEDDASNVEDASEVEDAEEVEDKEDDYMVEQLEKYGLTEEEISVYQDLPAD